MKRGLDYCAIDIYCIAALTSLSESVSYITSLFSEWRMNIQVRSIGFVVKIVHIFSFRTITKQFQVVFKLEEF